MKIPEADLSTFIMYLAQVTVPIVVTFLIKEWLKKGAKAQGEFAKQVEHLSVGLSGIHEKLNRLELKMVASGLDDLKANIDNLKEARTKTEMRIEAIFRSIEPHKKVNE
jgi:hypothetical protein